VERDDASRVMAYKLSVEPIRKHDRNDKVEPTVNISKELDIELNFTIP
jgi:hypothetical protein